MSKLWSMNEQKAKIYRILELEKEGFNVPRSFNMERDAPDNRFDQFIVWMNKIHYKDPKQIFNIRTYNFHRREGESLHTEHITDIPYDDLMHTTLHANLLYHTMIDAETPDNGRVAGNIIISSMDHEDSYSFHQHLFLIDCCSKPIRAMVRDANTEIKGKIRRDFDTVQNTYPLTFDMNPEPFLETVDNESIFTIFREVATKALSFSRKDVILEWTWFCEPAGIKGENLVWWEYRKAEK